MNLQRFIKQINLHISRLQRANDDLPQWRRHSEKEDRLFYLYFDGLDPSAFHRSHFSRATHKLICIYSKRTTYCSIIAFVSNDCPNEGPNRLPQNPICLIIKTLCHNYLKGMNPLGWMRHWKSKYVSGFCVGWKTVYLSLGSQMRSLGFISFFFCLQSACCTDEILCSDQDILTSLHLWQPVFKSHCCPHPLVLPTKKKKNILSRQEMSEPIAMETVL